MISTLNEFELKLAGGRFAPTHSEVAAAIAVVPRSFVVQHRLAPLALAHGKLSVLAVSDDPFEGLDALGCMSGWDVVPTFAPSAAVTAVIETCYGVGAIAASLPPADVENEGKGEQQSLSDSGHSPSSESAASDAPIIARVQEVIEEAIRRRASDIHLEPQSGRLRIRYRIDGVLQEVESPPKELQAAIISRVKIMADISIAEKRVPQDGRIQLLLPAGKSVDLRVSVVPSLHGETVVMRLLRRETLQPGLSELGIFDDDRREFERLMAAPDGIVLVTGPTGSGKTTTLYSCLSFLNQPNRKIITVEDPVEYQLSGVNQVPVRQEIGMTFAAALRAILRQAPNVVMVGEIRDRETAGIALQAALTGHLIFSTLHTNDAIGAVTRLMDLGVKPFLLATALRGVLAQRLVRKICPSCSQPYQPTESELRSVGLATGSSAAAGWMRGSGCANCDGTGYAGRVAICELLVISDELRSLIHAGATSAQLRSQVRTTGLRTLRVDGLRKVTAGLTTIEEVVSMTAGDAT